MQSGIASQWSLTRRISSCRCALGETSLIRRSPFSRPGSASHNEQMSGWRAPDRVRRVSDRFAARALESQTPYNVNVAASAAAIATCKNLEKGRGIQPPFRARAPCSPPSTIPFLQAFPSETILIHAVFRDSASNLGMSGREGVLVRYYEYAELSDACAFPLVSPILRPLTSRCLPR